MGLLARVPKGSPAKRTADGFDFSSVPQLTPWNDRAFRRMIPKEGFLHDDAARGGMTYARTHRLKHRIVRMPLKWIYDDDNQMRKTYDWEYIRHLADTVGVIGLLHPISLLEEIPHQRYTIIAGHCRTRAAWLLGWNRIPSIVFKALNEETRIEIQISENTYQPVPPWEAAEKYVELHDGLVRKYGKFPLAELARIIGRSPSALSDAREFVTISPFVKDCVRDGHFPYGGAVCLAKIKANGAQDEIAVNAMNSCGFKTYGDIQNEFAVNAMVNHTRVLVRHVKALVESYIMAKNQTSMEELMYKSREEAEKEMANARRFHVEQVAHRSMMEMRGYWERILYLHRKNQGTQYDPLLNESVRERFGELEQTVAKIRAELDGRKKKE
ncbi:Nucleoid occlusion protein [uncultured archaeon]|nr:Nucleoid occlusion protein [uncultured archaeon]